MRRAVVYLIIFLFLLTAAGAQAWGQQQRKVSGVVLDSVDKTPVEKCTVMLLQKGRTDKTLTNEKGFFSFSTVADSITLVFQHTGYIEKHISLVAMVQKMADTVLLSPADKLMDSIVIKAPLPPVVVHGDTTDFNIDSTMFEPYDVVEDLVKRLPGIEIDAAGGITYQGKKISRILVDGEDLFGGNPEFSMKKLPAGLVAKIQVMDTKTLEQLFTNRPAEEDDMTLNIKLKSGAKTFGSGGILAGTRNQLEGEANASAFEGAKRISITGTVNTSNKIGWAKQNTAPSSYMATTGIDYGNRLGTVNVNGGYSYNENGNANELYRERTQLITADTSFFTRSRNRFNYKSTGHRLNANANWAIDSFTVLNVNLSFNAARNTTENSTSSTTMENGSLRNEAAGNSAAAGNYQTLSASAFWVRRFRKKQRTLSLNFATDASDQATNDRSSTTNTYFKNGGPVSGDTLDRNTKTVNNLRSYSAGLSYSEAIGKFTTFSVESSLAFTNNATNRSIYNLDSATKTSAFDSLYSAQIRSGSTTQSLTASLNFFNEKKFRLTTGLTTFFQQSVRRLQKEMVRQSLSRYSPSVNAQYSFSKEKLLRLNLSATTVQPTIDQLQPVPDNSNPLYVRLGNPNLRTAFIQNYAASYNDYTASRAVAARLSYAPVSNQIVNAVYYDEFRRQTSRFTNVSGVYTLRGNITLSKTVRQEKRYRTIGLSWGGNYGQQVFFQSNHQYYTRTYGAQNNLSFTKREQVARPTSFAVSVGSSYNRTWVPFDAAVLNTTRLNIAPRMEISRTVAGFIYTSASYTVGYNKISYHSLLRRNDEYSLHNLSGNLNFRVKKNCYLETDFTYSYTTQVPDGTAKGMPSLNLYASARMLKGGRAEIKFAALNLLAVRNDLRRVTGDNYIEDVQTTTLRNYFTLRFGYNFSRIEKSKRKAKE